jgi:hypothetical protein
MTFKENFNWQKHYAYAFRDILHQNISHLLDIREATFVEDTGEATDFVIEVKGGTVAARVRRDNCDYRELTIRCYSSGAKTEIHKIREGFGRWYLYCWTDEHGDIADWILIDLDIMRQSGILNKERLKKERPEIPNKDGKTKFYAFRLDELEKEYLLIAHQFETDLGKEKWKTRVNY